MPLFRHVTDRVRKHAAVALLLACCASAGAFQPVPDMAVLYITHVDRRLAVEPAEVGLYARLAEEALAHAGVTPVAAQYLVVVDRNPRVQALFLLFRPTEGAVQLVGASPVSTGQPGRFDHFETPLGCSTTPFKIPTFAPRALSTVRGFGGTAPEECGCTTSAGSRR